MQRDRDRDRETVRDGDGDRDRDRDGDRARERHRETETQRHRQIRHSETDIKTQRGRGTLPERPIYFDWRIYAGLAYALRACRLQHTARGEVAAKTAAYHLCLYRSLWVRVGASVCVCARVCGCAATCVSA